MPLQYPNGDSVTIWVEPYGDRLRVSDYGESFIDVAGRRRRDVTDMETVATDIGRRWAVEVMNGSLLVQARPEDLGDAVWRVATVACRVAQAAQRFRPTKTQHDREQHFAREVELELRGHNLTVEREVRLAGASGHQHKATLYIPTVEAILEPISASGHANQINSVYAKFGDLSRANGYRRLSLVDDRHGRLSDDLAGMLVQVSDVVGWTRRDEWIDLLS
jgi:hypothetical protein